MHFLLRLCDEVPTRLMAAYDAGRILLSCTIYIKQGVSDLLLSKVNSSRTSSKRPVNL